jgi:uncharacterized protein
MQLHRHPLPAASPGTNREIVSFHYGRTGGRKAYLQASLHADELPGMLVAHHLRQQLEQLEKEGRILGEIVVVPVANPIGIGQAIQGDAFGRFDLGSGINFNRGYQHLTPRLKETLAGKLGHDAGENIRLVRREALRLLEETPAWTETEVMKKILLTLAVDADIALDLHCDQEAVMHLYTGTPLAERIMPLAALLGAQVVLTARESGDDPFDEACSRTWWEMAEHIGAGTPLPCACLSATVELRGETDVRHDYARQDAEALVAFLMHEGLIQGSVAKSPQAGEPRHEASPLPLPLPLCEPTPLEGVDPLVAPHGGLLVFMREVGEVVEKDAVIAEVIDPVSGQTTQVRTAVPGRLFARTSARFVQRGTRFAKVAGAMPFRSGKLLGA